ncbi:MAG: aminotransferase class I/II-fold pyridoxal phosphate-dependent enzyme [Peptostreptococcaceae bacterium]|nr:aminotransferase class I/II-fold pyridoxal phosphate-dependent enzyme [Peptostreptococcaceae bacterium]
MKHGGDYVGYYDKYGKMPIDYSENTSPFGLPIGVKSAICDSLDIANRYPDPYCRELRNKLATYHNVPANSIICGNGAADIIYRLALALKPKKALVTAPTFSEYKSSLNLIGCEIINHALKEENDFKIDEDIFSLIDDDLDVMYICQPNNPTGMTCEENLLLRILNKCRADGVMLVVDECFLDFVEGGISLIPKLEEYDNLLILKAFTKLYAMAGVRLGYAISASSYLLSKMRASGQPWNVSTMAQAAGIAAMDEKDYVKRVISNTQKERRVIFDGLNKLEIRHIESEANYILIYTESEDFAIKMEEKGFLIRDCSNYIGLDEGWYRIAVKKHEDNLKLLSAMEEVIIGK